MYNKVYDVSSGQKGLTVNDVVDRSLPLQKVQRTFSKDITVIINVDQLHMVRIPGIGLRPAAVIETTLCENNSDYPMGPNELYLARCLKRIRDNSCQGEIVTWLAATHDVPCFFLVHDGLVVSQTKEIVAATKIFLYPLSTQGDWSLLFPDSTRKGWLKLLPEDYERFLFWIKDQCLSKYSLAATAP